MDPLPPPFFSHYKNPTLTFAVAERMRSSRVSSLRSWWWEPLPLEMISTPASASPMWGACARGGWVQVQVYVR
jgi:hypothetical protein